VREPAYGCWSVRKKRNVQSAMGENQLVINSPDRTFRAYVWRPVTLPAKPPGNTVSASMQPLIAMRVCEM